MNEKPVFDQVFLSVGAVKAGTTWLYDVMSRHPDVHFSHEKEIHYFYAQALRPGLLPDRARMRRAKGSRAVALPKSDISKTQSIRMPAIR